LIHVGREITTSTRNYCASKIQTYFGKMKQPAKYG
jgi:hypothetical protein